jgi:hypothetical protein
MGFCVAVFSKPDMEEGLNSLKVMYIRGGGVELGKSKREGNYFW